MIRTRFRRLLKFRDDARGRVSVAGSRQVLRRRLNATSKFTKVFRITASAYRDVVRKERRSGGLAQSELQAMILQWARDILGVLSLNLEIKGSIPNVSTPVLFVGNHLSYVDIPLLMASVPVVFVAKEEVSKWLIIGEAARKAGTVFVKRESGASRANAADAVIETIVKHQRSIAIFPSGTTCLRESKPWRRGAFKIAEKHDITIQPFRIRYEPMRKVAYVDDDTFATHLLSLLHVEQLKATIEFGPSRKITNIDQDIDEIREWTRQGLGLS